jgi:hypothetical protein
MSDLIRNIESIFENMEEYSEQVKAHDPFLKKVYELQLQGVEFSEIQAFKRYAICTAKNDVQQKVNPIKYYSMVETDKGDIKYYELNHRNASWDSNEAGEITAEDFNASVIPDIVAPDKDITNKDSNYSTKDEVNNPKIKEAEGSSLRFKNYPNPFDSTTLSKRPN